MKISNTKMVIEISSNSDSDSEDYNSSNNDSELEKSIIDQKQIRYFKPDQTQLVYNGYIYNFIVKNKNKTSRWRCSTCCGCALVNVNSNIISFIYFISFNLSKGNKRCNYN